MNILIINQPLGNRGDESAHKAFIRQLMKRLPDSRIEVLTINQKKEDIDIFRIPEAEYTNVSPGRFFYKFYIGSIQRRMPFLASLHPQTRFILRKFSQADRIICAPGGINLGGFRDWTHLATMFHALRHNGNVAYFSRSIGPFDNDTFSVLSRQILQSVSFLSLRDSQSFETALSIGCNGARITSDSAFLEKPQTRLPDRFKNLRYAVLVPNELVWHPDFKTLDHKTVTDFFSNLAKRVHDEFSGIGIVMLPQLCGLQNDVNFMKSMAQGMDFVTVCEANVDSDTQQAIIRNADYLIGCRYHSIVFAINNDTAFAALEYEHKIGGLLEMTGLSDRAVKLKADNLNTDTIGKLIDILKTPFRPAGRKAAEIAANGFDELIRSIS